MEAIKINNQAVKTSLKWTFIIVSAAFTSTVLLFYSYLLKGLVPASNLTREYLICFGQLAFQGTLLLCTGNKAKMPDYFFELMKVPLLGALLLTPVLVSAFLLYPLTPGAHYYLAYFMAIVIYMFFNHKKRVENIGAPYWLSYTWVLYRVLILMIIL